MQKFLTTAPVVAAIWFTLTAGILIEWNRFFPDLLFHPLGGSTSRSQRKGPLGPFFAVS